MDERYRAEYSKLYHHHWWWRAREEALLHELRSLRHGKARGRLLDVGCGDGLFLERLQEFGVVEGIEPDATLLSTESLQQHRIHVGTLDATYVCESPFDIVLFLDVLEHLDDPISLLREARRRLSPDGRILVTVPAYRALWTAHDDLNDHRMRYSPRELAQTMLAAGLRVERLRHLFLWVAAAKLVIRAGESLAGRKPRPPRIPGTLLNGILLNITRADHAVGRVLRMPFGASLLAVLRTT